MKLSQIISMIVIFTIATTTSIFFLHDASNTPTEKSSTPPKVEFKWGEGTEGGASDTAGHN